MVIRTLPDTRIQLPFDRWDIPATARDIPANTRDIPATARDIPATARDIPANARDIPATTRDSSIQLHNACQQFEAVFLLQLWRAMQRTVPRERQTLNYAEMFDLTFAEYLARYGQFGIAEKLYEQLTRGCQTP
jgi:Rod binding domain-containing protein